MRMAPRHGGTVPCWCEGRLNLRARAQRWIDNRTWRNR